MDDETSRPPHQWVASKIAFSVAGVSLLRGGQRLPSFPTMLCIEKEFDWDLSDQTTARVRGDYAAKFEEALEKAYAQEQQGQ